MGNYIDEINRFKNLVATNVSTEIVPSLKLFGVLIVVIFAVYVFFMLFRDMSADYEKMYSQGSITVARFHDPNDQEYYLINYRIWEFKKRKYLKQKFILGTIINHDYVIKIFTGRTPYGEKRYFIFGKPVERRMLFTKAIKAYVKFKID